MSAEQREDPRLEELRNVLLKREVLVNRISPVIADIIREQASANPERFAEALAPVVGEALRRHIQQRPQDIAEALAPLANGAPQQQTTTRDQALPGDLSAQVRQTLEPLADEAVRRWLHEHREELISILAPVMPAILEKQINDSPEQIARVIAPVIDQALHERVREKPEEIATVIQPIVDAAVRRAAPREALKSAPTAERPAFWRQPVGIATLLLAVILVFVLGWWVLRVEQRLARQAALPAIASPVAILGAPTSTATPVATAPPAPTFTLMPTPMLTATPLPTPEPTATWTSVPRATPTLALTLAPSPTVVQVSGVMREYVRLFDRPLADAMNPTLIAPKGARVEILGRCCQAWYKVRVVPYRAESPVELWMPMRWVDLPENVRPEAVIPLLDVPQS
jgi:hypothetical protein